MDLGHAPVSTAKQDLDASSASRAGVGILADRSTSTNAPARRPTGAARGPTPRPRLDRDLDRLNRAVRDTLNLIYELTERAVVLLPLPGQLERTYTPRVAHTRAVATAKGRRIGRPPVIDPHKLACPAHLREAGDTIAEIVAKTGITLQPLPAHPPRPTSPSPPPARSGRGPT